MFVARRMLTTLREFLGAELLTDGDMEAVGVAAWVEAVAGTITKETGTPFEGSQVLRIARNAINNPRYNQTIMTVGKRYRITGRARSDGNAIPRLTSGVVFFTGTTSTDWQVIDFELLATNTALNLQSQTSTGNEYTEWDVMSVKEVL